MSLWFIMNISGSLIQKFKGSDRLDIAVDMRVQYFKDFFSIHLRPVERFYSLKMLKKRYNLIFKITPDCPFWR